MIFSLKLKSTLVISGDSEIQNVRAHRAFCSRVPFAEGNKHGVSMEAKKERNGVLWQSVCEKYPRAAKVPKIVLFFSSERNNFNVGTEFQMNRAEHKFGNLK